MGGSAFYRIYETSDGRHLVLGGQEIKFVRNLLGAFDRLDLVPLCECGPGSHQAPVVEFLAETFRQKTLADWTSWFEGRDICFAPVNTLPEAFVDPQVSARATIHVDELGRRHIAPVARFRDEPAEPSWKEPDLGEANAILLGELFWPSAASPVETREDPAVLEAQV